MSEKRDGSLKFTLRFHDRMTHELLGVVADRFGMSKNQLAEEMLGRELQAAALYLESDLIDTVERLRSYRREDRLDQDIQAVAEAEAYHPDPVRSRMVTSQVDAFEIIEVFKT